MPARRHKPADPKIKTFLSVQEIEGAIGQLRGRISEVQAIDPSAVSYRDQAVRNVEENIRYTILDVFGPGSFEYLEHGRFQFFRFASKIFNGDQEAQRFFATQALPQTVTLLENLVTS